MPIDIYTRTVWPGDLRAGKGDLSPKSGRDTERTVIAKQTCPV